MNCNGIKADKVPSELSAILAYVDGGSGTSEVIEAAARIGKACSSYVEVLHIEKPIDDALPAMDVGGSLVAATEIFAMMKQDAEQRTFDAKAAFDAFCKTSDIKAVSPDSQETLMHDGMVVSWNLMSGNDNRDLANRGRLFDLIVVARAKDQIGGVDSVQLEAALFDTGRPVLVTSDAFKSKETSSIAIAWDGSREAAHSVALALPFLTKAEKVCIMSVGKCEPGMGFNALGRYLARHGVQAEHCLLETSGKSVADTLVEASLDKDAGLLVMGAYGHSALGESLFGGVTRDLLEDGKIPLLLAH